jgi:hypothetical protein
MKKIFVVLLTLIVVFSSSLAFAEYNKVMSERDATNMIADTIILRPLGFAATVIGGAIFLVSLPISAITKSTTKTYEVLVKEPFDYTFVRPVGELGSGL